jgi:K+-sensing histidine kinase KdpD
VRHADPHPGIPQRTARPLALGRSSAFCYPADYLRFHRVARGGISVASDRTVTIVYLIGHCSGVALGGFRRCLQDFRIGAAAFFLLRTDYDFRVHSPAQIADIVLFMTVATITGRVAVAVRQAKIRAQAESLRDALIGSVSHELRTPLASIVGSASILAQSQVIDRDEHLSSLVRLVLGEAERLNGDIQNLVDATRISSDEIRPHPAWVDPEDIVNGALVRKRRLLGDRPIARCRRRFTADRY